MGKYDNRNEEEGKKGGLVKTVALFGAGALAYRSIRHPEGFLRKQAGSIDNFVREMDDSFRASTLSKEVRGFAKGVQDTFGSDPGISGLVLNRKRFNDGTLDRKIARASKSISEARAPLPVSVSRLHQSIEGAELTAHKIARENQLKETFSDLLLGHEKSRITKEDKDVILKHIHSQSENALFKKDVQIESIRAELKKVHTDKNTKLKLKSFSGNEDAYAEDVMSVLKKAKEIAEQNRQEFKAYKSGKISGIDLLANKYANQRIQMDALQFHAAYESTKGVAKSKRVKAQAANRFHPITFKEASTVKLNKNETVDDVYSLIHYTRDGKVKKKSTVESFYNKGKQFGYGQETLENHTFSDQIFYNKKTGEIRDFTGVDAAKNDRREFIQNNLQVPFMNFNPYDIAQIRTFKGLKEAPSFQVFRAGETLDFIDPEKLPTQDSIHIADYRSQSKPLSEDLVYSDGNIYKMNEKSIYDAKSYSEASKLALESLDETLLDSGYTLAPTNGNIFERMAKGVNGASAQYNEETSWIKDFLGLGQETDSMFTRARDFFTKFDKDEYGGNVQKRLLKDIISEEDLPKAKDMMDRSYSILNNHTKGLSAEAENVLNERLSKSLNQYYSDTGINFDDLVDEDSIVAAMQKITGIIEKSPNKDRTIEDDVIASIEKRIERFSDQYEANSIDFSNIKRKRNTEDAKEYIPSFFGGQINQTLSEGSISLVTGIDDVKKAMQELAISVSQDKHGNPLTIGQFMQELGENSSISSSIKSEVMDLNHHAKIGMFRDRMHSETIESMADAYQDFASYYAAGIIESKDLERSLRTADGFMGFGPPKEKTRNVIGDTSMYTPIKQKFSMIESMNENLVDAQDDFVENIMGSAKGIIDWGKQYTAGAHSRDNITTATALPYFFADRLDTAVSQFGLGLPNHMKGSAQSILWNQFSRRLALPFALYTGAQLADDITGGVVSDNLADAYVNMSGDTSKLSDITRFTDFKKNFKRLFPYIDQFSETPLGKVADFATFGAFNTRSYDEDRDYWSHGEDAVRKGRWWGIGSNSAYIGDKIDRYEPNWYRKVKSDYQFSDNMYGSKAEYWFNHPLVNPLEHFIIDPYHYENKLKDERPYAVTGGFSELDAIPIIGPVVDSVLSPIFKPRRVDSRLKDAHIEYLRSYNERIANSYIASNQPGNVALTENGKFAFTSLPTNTTLDQYDEDGNIDTEALDEYNETQNSVLGRNGGRAAVGGKQGYVQTVAGMKDRNIFQRMLSAITGNNGDIKQAITEMNQNLASSSISERSTTGRPNQVIDPGTVYDLNSLQNTSELSMAGAGRDVIYNASEMAGLFGFLGKTGFSWDEKRDGPVLQDSELFSDYSRKFWDKELGGVGGDVSEIIRRYLPRDSSRDYYNPIRNTMPGWMPGAEYFTDFLHGDPYSKVANGIMRLPGDAYEKLYNVKKDADGNYSAMDRYRILADIAPYSDQYKLAKKEMSLLNGNGELSEEENDEYKEIREQVKNRKRKKLTYNTRFIEDKMDTTKETVTVKKVIDANTFLTEEYGNNPIKFAGVRVKADDEERIDLISQFIRPGAKLKIELDADPSRRIRNDMMQTMRAVVYTNKGEDDNYFGLFGVGKGENLNYILANRKFSKDVTIQEDGSAVATKALYDGSERNIGKAGEFITHQLLPSIPGVNIVADKFLKVQSPVEAYRKDLYSKSWRDWAHPIQDWIRPAAETNMARNPILALGNGYMVGRLMARRNKTYWGLGLGLLSGVGASSRAIIHAINRSDEDWIPKRRKEERELDEYFDKLKYVKYKGLFEKSKELAKKYEGVDLDKVLNDQNQHKNETKKYKKILETRKKWLSIEKKSGYGNQEFTKWKLQRTNEEINALDVDPLNEEAGIYTSMALRYKDEMESTLYGAEDNLDFKKIYRAMPAKDRQFFTDFMKASPKEKAEIIRMVPKNQRRIYQQMFNMNVDEKESLDDYFKDKNLPGKNWEGWQASTSLDDIKVKVMQNEGMTLTEANYWDDDVERAKQSNVSAIEPFRPKLSHSIDVRRLEDALKGAGVKDVFISMQTTSASNFGFSADIDFTKDREQEVKDGVMNRLSR